MDNILQQFQNLPWYKSDWSFLSMTKTTNTLLHQCKELPTEETVDNFDEVVKKSKAFPIPFPIETVRLKTLKARRPIERLKKNIESTYPLIHERVLLLMTRFLIFKREFGSSIETAFYKDMTVPEFIDRILKKRAISFMGPKDRYKLITGEEGYGCPKGSHARSSRKRPADGVGGRRKRGPGARGASNTAQDSNEETSLGYDGWSAVGTLQQKPPLILENCLSYDEMKISAMVFVSGFTECINDGLRKNAGVVNEKNIESNAVIIGVIGPRFQRKSRMDYEDILITEQQNISDNGYGEEKNNKSPKHMFKQIWSEFYQVPNYTYEELTSSVKVQEKPKNRSYTDRYVKLPINTDNIIFDNEIYYKRLIIIAECTLQEAEERAKEVGKDAFVNVIGCGLGVWKISVHQTDVYILSFLEIIKSFLKRDLLNHVSDINFSYIPVSKNIQAIFTKSTNSKYKLAEKGVFLESKKHPRGGINVQLQKREPSTKLTGEHEGKLLVMTYPWDGNAHPGNEFWLAKLTSSGDPAAACSTQVSELHNAYVNARVSATNTRVATGGGLMGLSDYCDKHCG